MGGATLAEEQALLLDLGKMMKAEYDRQQMVRVQPVIA
jgi:hypothetical protein